MGAGFGLVRGLIGDVIGAQQGVADRGHLERQAIQQALAESLLMARIGDVRSQARLRDVQARNPKADIPHTVWAQGSDGVTRLWQYNPRTQTWSPAQSDDTASGASPPAEDVTDLDVSTSPLPRIPSAGTQGPGLRKPTIPKPTARIDPNSAEGIAAAIAKRPPPKPPAAPKAASPVERETKAAARTGLGLIAEMKALQEQNKAASQLPLGTSIARGPSRLPVLGEALKGLTEPLAQQFLSKEQAAYQQKADQLLHLASSVLPKGGRSLALLQNLRASFTSPALAKNPQAATEALRGLEAQLKEVLGEGGGDLLATDVDPVTGKPRRPPTATSGPSVSEKHQRLFTRFHTP